MHAGGQEFDPPRLHQVPSLGPRWPLGKGASKHETGFLKSQRPSAAKAALGRWLRLRVRALFTIRSMKLKHLSLAWGRCNPKKSNTTRTTSASCAAVLKHCRACGERTQLRVRAQHGKPPHRKVTGDVRLPCGLGSRGLGYMVKRTSAFGGCLGS